MWKLILATEVISPETMLKLVESGVASVGFPIVMCVLLFLYITIEGKKQREQTSELRDEIKSLKDSIDTLNRGLIDILSRLTNK